MTDAETKRLVDAVYGKDKEAKVLKNLKIGQANAKREFLKKTRTLTLINLVFKLC